MVICPFSNQAEEDVDHVFKNCDLVDKYPLSFFETLDYSFLDWIDKIWNNKMWCSEFSVTLQNKSSQLFQTISNTETMLFRNHTCNLPYILELAMGSFWFIIRCNTTTNNLLQDFNTGKHQRGMICISIASGFHFLHDGTNGTQTRPKWS